MTATDIRVPASAAWLGGLGLVPFIGLAAALPFVGPQVQSLATHALLAYGATILSFLGGIHWGLGIARAAVAPAGGLAGRLTLSIVPSLVAWIALLAPPFAGLILLATGIALMVRVDILATRSGVAPPWYPRLRIPLSCAVATPRLVAGLVVR